MHLLSSSKDHSCCGMILIVDNVRYPSISPIKIQIGDIVEVQMSIVAVPVKGRESKLMTLLRSVTIMDGTYTQVSSET